MAEYTSEMVRPEDFGPLRPEMDCPYNRKTLERIASRATRLPSGCWVSSYSRTSHRGDPYGYPQIGWMGRTKRIHTLLYLLLRGDLLPDHEVDHTCRIRECNNPDHLQQITCAEHDRDPERARRSGQTLRGRTCEKWGHRLGDMLRMKADGMSVSQIADYYGSTYRKVHLAMQRQRRKIRNGQY